MSESKKELIDMEILNNLMHIIFLYSTLIVCIIFVTKSAKKSLICTKYTYSFYHIYLFFCVGYTISVSFIKFLRKFGVYDEIFDKLLY